MSSVGMGGGGAAPIQPGQPSGVPKEKDVKSAKEAGKLNKEAAAQTGLSATDRQFVKDYLRMQPNANSSQVNIYLKLMGKPNVQQSDVSTLKEEIKILEFVANDKKAKAAEVLSHLPSNTQKEKINTLVNLKLLTKQDVETIEILDMVQGDHLVKNNAENLIIQLRKEGDSKNQIIAFLRDQGMIK